MIQTVDHNDEDALNSKCCVGDHPFRVKLSGSAGGYPEVKIGDSYMCYFHYWQINVHGLDNFKASAPVPIMQIEVAKRNRADRLKKEEAERVRRAKGNQPGFVYYIRMDNLIKIGYAGDVAKRMRAYPPSAELLAMHPGTMALERQMHEQYQAHKRRGREWFAPKPDLMAHIEGVRKQFGDPSRFAYKYTEAKIA